MRDEITIGEALPNEARLSPDAQRAAEHRSAQQLIGALVDFLSASLYGQPPHLIGDVAHAVTARAVAQASARQFVETCDLLEPAHGD